MRKGECETVRLDKWLQVSRLVKRRTVAKELCDAGRVRLGGRVAKAGSEVASGDTLEVDFGWRRVEVRILSAPERGRPSRADAAELYEVLRQERRQDAPEETS